MARNGGLVLVILISIVLTIVSAEGNANVRIDCFSEAQSPEETVNQSSCEARGCFYDDSPTPANAPKCYMPQDGTTGFRVVSGPEDTTLGQRWILQRKTELGIYDTNLEYLTFDVEMRRDNLLRFKFDDANATDRYTVPLEVNMPQTKASNPAYQIEVEGDPFSLKVIRKSTGKALWDMTVGGLVFSDQFIQIATKLPSPNVYGFGENSHASFKHDLNYKTWPLFARDQGPSHDKEYNLYSVHPFYECLEDDSNAHGVFLLNSNAMDYTLTDAPMLVYKTVGGILDFYMFLGPTPENVVQQYTGLIGRPYMPPYWALGFQLCRYGWKNLEDMQGAVDRTLSYDIPLDVVYGDIDYMDRQRIFTIDPINFAEMPEYFSQLRSKGMKIIVILDPCIEVNDTSYEPYTRGKELDVFIKWPDEESVPPGDFEEEGLNLMGYVWPEWKVVFPDFFKDSTATWWKELILKFREEDLEFDGLWLDMNEPANFDTNKKGRVWNWPEDRLPYWSLNCTYSKWDDPPYRTKAAYQYDYEGWKNRLSGKTICMQAVQNDGALRHYDVHNLYGWKQTYVTLPILREAVGHNRRSIIVSRSTYAGSGSKSGRWLGDNGSNWKDMHRSIIGMLEFNLFGFPYIGADICGFFGNSTASMCRRWQELGAFYPYSRNHNQADAHDQDPGYWGDAVAIPTRETLLIRYTLLPYLYTLFHRAHTRGDTVVRPLFHEFQDDAETFHIDTQFLWGSAFLISPILEEDASQLKYYVPEGRWYDYSSGKVASEAGKEEKTVAVDDDTSIQLHVRGGYILPTQKPANNTASSRLNDFGLIVALDKQDGEATGELFWDDGETIDTYDNEQYYFATFECKQSGLVLKIDQVSSANWISSLKLSNITVYGVSAVEDVRVNDDTIETYTYDSGNSVLRIVDLALPMTAEAEITWSLKTSSAVKCQPISFLSLLALLFLFLLVG